MRHACRHTCTRGGGGCCVRSEGAAGVQSEIYPGFLSFTLGRVGVMAECSATAVCELIQRAIRVFVCISEGVEQN